MLIARQTMTAVARSRAVFAPARLPGAAMRIRTSAVKMEQSGTAAPSALLALTLTNLAVAGQSMADEAAIAIGSEEKQLFALSPAEIVLVLTPVIGYGLFNIAREKNPKLTISDGLLFIAAAFIVGNIFSILVFKTSFY